MTVPFGLHCSAEPLHPTPESTINHRHKTNFNILNGFQSRTSR